jgi:hypothetical protein
MPTLYPPEYPDCPAAPLTSFGPSFSEEISRSVIGAVLTGDDESQDADEIRAAAALTMLEAFHPRDHLDCMLAAQGVGFHMAIMDSLGRAMRADTPLAMVVKLRASATQMNRGFSVILRDLERRQSKPLTQRPPATPPADPPIAPRRNAPKGKGPRGNDPQADGPRLGGPGASDEAAASAAELALDDIPERPEDIEFRPDGTPGSLAAYVPKPPPEPVYIPREAPIMLALATRPKPWRQVNAANDHAEPAPQEQPPEEQSPAEATAPRLMRGRMNEKMLGGDALSRFASARLDPNAPVKTLCFEHEDAMVELELISTGGDPEAEAERAAMIAAHPEGKPIATFRYGSKIAPKDPADDG